MQFSELKAVVKGIGCGQLRADEDNYFETVIIKDKVGEFFCALERFFGPPVWPPENKLPSQIEDVIKKFGGIVTGQTLYFCHQDNNIVFAMLWPWSDEEHITLKIRKLG